MKAIGIAFVLAVVACGKENGGATQPNATAAARAAVSVAGAMTAGGTAAAVRTASTAAPPRVPVPTVSGPGTQTIDVRLHGVSASGSVLVSPSAVAVTIDGQPVATQLIPDQIDLGDETQAWKIATFGLPASAQTVAIQITLASQGTVVLNGNTEKLTINGPPISFPAVPVQLQLEDKVSLDVDLSISVVAQGGGAVLLPDLNVRYN